MRKFPWSEKRPLGLFNIYATLKLPFSDPPITLHHEWSKDPPFIIYISFLKLKKKRKIRTIHDTSIHVFKQLNQIVRFKYKNDKRRVRISICNEQPLRGVLSHSFSFSSFQMNLSSSSDFPKLFLIFFHNGEHFDTATCPFWGINLFL